MLHRKFRKKLFGDDRAEERRNTNPYFCVSAAGNIVRTLAVIVEGFQELLRSASGKESYRGAEHAEATGTGGHGRYHHGSKSSQQNAYQYLQGI